MRSESLARHSSRQRLCPDRNVCGRVIARLGLRKVPMPSHEIVDLSFSFVTLIAVAFLNSADQLFSVPLRAINIVVRQFSPLRLDVTFELAPFPLQDVFVHDSAPFNKHFRRTVRSKWCAYDLGNG